MFTNKQINEFCTLEMHLNGAAYIKVINGKNKQFDSTKMSNEFIFQHALEETDQYLQILASVINWWNYYCENAKWLK